MGRQRRQGTETGAFVGRFRDREWALVARLRVQSKNLSALKEGIYFFPAFSALWDWTVFFSLFFMGSSVKLSRLLMRTLKKTTPLE